MVALPFSTVFLSPGDEVVKHASPGIFNTLYLLHIILHLKEVYEVPACLDTCKRLIHFRAFGLEC